jgi:WD40 repeat protein
LKLGDVDPRKDVGTAAFSPDGRTAYIVYGDRQVQRWDVSKGVRLKPDLDHPGDVEQIRFSADGKLALTLGDGDAKVWDTVTGSAVGKAFYAGRRDAAALSPDGSKAAGFNFEGQLFVAAVGRKKALYKLKTDRPRVGRINALGFSPDSRSLVTVGKVAQVWNAATGTLLAEGGGHESARRVAFSPGGDVFLVVDGGRVHLWKMPAR